MDNSQQRSESRPKPGYPPFGREFLDFIRLLRIEPEEFHPQRREHEPEELRWSEDGLHLSRSVVIDYLRGKRARMRQAMAERWAARASFFLSREIARQISNGTLSQFEKVLTKFSFVVCRQGTWIVDAGRLARSYEASKTGRPLRADTDGHRTVRLELILDQPFDSLSPGDLEQTLARLVGERKYRLIAESEGCTAVTIEVDAEGAEDLNEKPDAPTAGESRLIAICDRTGESGSIVERLSPAPVLIDPMAPDHSERFRREWRRARLREGIVRPWRRLRFVFSPDVRSCRLAHVIAESGERAYCIPGLAARRASLAVDLRMAIVLWPTMTTLLVGFLLFRLGIASPPALFVGVLTGAALALLGAQPCSLVVSPLVCGGGGVVMSIGFGFAQTLIFARLNAAALFSRTAVRRDFFTAVTGGLVGLSAPAWPAAFPPASIVLLISLVALSIAAAAWLMAQPGRARRDSVSRPAWRHWTGTLAGSAAGGGIGLVNVLGAITGRGASQPWSFILAFAIAGGAAVALAVFLATGEIERAVPYTVSHLALASILFATAYETAGTPIGWLSLAAASGYFHSTWFTAAFMIGQSIGGIPAAVGAAVLEGSLGFSAFVILRLLGVA